VTAGWVSWADFKDAAPQLAEFGESRLNGDVPSYLATVRGKALPRVHPVQAIVSPHRLLLFMFPSSPKAHDLERDGRFALHTAVVDNDGSNGEFFLRGRARRVSDSEVRKEATQWGYEPRPEYILFELDVGEAVANVYENGKPSFTRWRAPR
jgi:hypothetical protein